MSGFIAHLENYLGEIDGGWFQRAEEGEETPPFQVVRFAGGAVPGVVAYATLGLARTELRARVTEDPVRMEFVMLIAEHADDSSVPEVMREVGMRALDSGSAVLRGDVIGPEGTTFSVGSQSALYATLPSSLPPEFATHNGATFAWLAPISDSEARFVGSLGWSSFETHIKALNIDLTDPERLSAA